MNYARIGWLGRGRCASPGTGSQSSGVPWLSQDQGLRSVCLFVVNNSKKSFKSGEYLNPFDRIYGSVALVTLNWCRWQARWYWLYWGQVGRSKQKLRRNICNLYAEMESDTKLIYSLYEVSAGWECSELARHYYLSQWKKSIHTKTVSLFKLLNNFLYNGAQIVSRFSIALVAP